MFHFIVSTNVTGTETPMYLIFSILKMSYINLLLILSVNVLLTEASPKPKAF